MDKKVDYSVKVSSTYYKNNEYELDEMNNNNNKNDNNVTETKIERKSLLSVIWKSWDKYVYTFCILLNYILYVSFELSC